MGGYIAVKLRSVIWIDQSNERVALKELVYCLPTGYALIYSIFTASYIILFEGPLISGGVFTIAVLLTMALLSPVVLKKRVYKTHINELNSGFFILALVLAITVIPQLILGSLPFWVSDSWTHISYINRLLINDSTVISGAWLPNEIYAIKFSPHHAFLSSIAQATGSTALETWIGASFVLPFLLILSYFSFIDSAFPNLMKSRKEYSVLAIVFVLLFAICNDIFRGSAGYRIASCIIFFQIARYIFLSIETPGNRKAILAVLIACCLTATMATTHLVEVMIILLMLSPYLAVRSVQKRNIKPLIISCVWSIFSVIVALIVVRLFYSDFPLPLKTETTLESFWPFFHMKFKRHIDYGLFTVFLMSLYILWKYRSPAFIFVSLSLVTVLIFSPINPLIFNPLINFGGSNLVWRVLFVPPIYLAIGAALAIVVRHTNFSAFIMFNRRTIILLMFAFSTAAAFTHHFYYWWHLDGTLGYQHSDSASQLRLFPRLYNELKNYNNEIILSDTITSAPINAVTTNYIVTHRPWTQGPDPERFHLAKASLKSPNLISSRDFICKNMVSLLLINTAQLPSKLQTETERYPWLMNEFYGSKEDYKKTSFLQFQGEFDSVDIYSVNQSIACNSH